MHPHGGADLTYDIVLRLAKLFGPRKIYANPRAYWHAKDTAAKAYVLALRHSREFAKVKGLEPSPLCWADKFCVFFDPMSFYFLRAWLTGELDEFKQHAQPHIGKVSAREWQLWYRGKVRTLIEEKCSLYYRDQVFRS